MQARALRRTSVPNLRLDDLAVVLDTPGGELDANGRLGVEVELVARESAQQVGLSDARVADDDHCRVRQAASASEVCAQPGSGAPSGRRAGSEGGGVVCPSTLEQIVVVVICTRCGHAVARGAACWTASRVLESCGGLVLTVHVNGHQTRKMCANFRRPHLR